MRNDKRCIERFLNNMYLKSIQFRGKYLRILPPVVSITLPLRVSAMGIQDPPGVSLKNQPEALGLMWYRCSTRCAWGEGRQDPPASPEDCELDKWICTVPFSDRAPSIPFCGQQCNVVPHTRPLLLSGSLKSGKSRPPAHTERALPVLHRNPTSCSLEKSLSDCTWAITT